MSTGDPRGVTRPCSAQQDFKQDRQGEGVGGAEKGSDIRDILITSMDEREDAIMCGAVRSADGATYSAILIEVTYVFLVIDEERRFL